MALTRRNLISATILGAAAVAAPMAQAKQKTPLKPMKVSPKRRVLIQSSSRYHNSGYLDFAGDQYEKLFGKEKYEILFIPYAKVAGTYDAYEKQVQDAFKPYGHKIVSIHRFKDPQKAVREAKAIAVGGGNTWALVTRMYEAGIIDLIRERVNAGVPYCGWSAGATSLARRCAPLTTCRSQSPRPSTLSALFRSKPIRTSFRAARRALTTKPVKTVWKSSCGTTRTKK